MKPKEIINTKLNERYFYLKHPSGLNIYVYPKKGYTSKYAVIGTDFGSINNTFKLKQDLQNIKVPDGIAHYLEHKLFANKEGDAFELFAKTGASANAYTSFEKTAYLFSCTDDFEKSLGILIDFVSSPYFTQENVDKERGIIAQEIKMYQDSPDWKLLINLLGCLYNSHPVKIDIAGSVESIGQITAETLYKCYDTFYTPNNMSLCIVGDLNVDEVLSFIDKKIKYKDNVEVTKIFPEEPANVAKKFVSESFDINSSMFSVGFKENICRNSRISTEDSVYTDIIINYLTSPCCEMYQELLNKNLINISTFSAEHLEGPGYSSVIFSGESQDPEKAYKIIIEYTSNLLKTGINKENFERVKKVVYGKSVAVFNNISSIANVLLDFSLSGKDFFGYMHILENANIEKLNARLSDIFKEDNHALSVIVPKK